MLYVAVHKEKGLNNVTLTAMYSIVVDIDG